MITQVTDVNYMTNKASINCKDNSAFEGSTNFSDILKAITCECAGDEDGLDSLLNEAEAQVEQYTALNLWNTAICFPIFTAFMASDKYPEPAEELVQLNKATAGKLLAYAGSEWLNSQMNKEVADADISKRVLWKNLQDAAKSLDLSDIVPDEFTDVSEYGSKNTSKASDASDIVITEFLRSGVSDIGPNTAAIYELLNLKSQDAHVLTALSDKSGAGAVVPGMLDDIPVYSDTDSLLSSETPRSDKTALTKSSKPESSKNAAFHNGISDFDDATADLFGTFEQKTNQGGLKQGPNVSSISSEQAIEITAAASELDSNSGGFVDNSAGEHSTGKESSENAGLAFGSFYSHIALKTDAASDPLALSGNRTMKPEILKKVIESFTLMREEGRIEMEVRIHPESLGKLQLRIVNESGVYSAFISAETPYAKDLIQSHLNDLRASLKEQGLDFFRLDVSLADSQNNSGKWFWQENRLQRFSGQDFRTAALAGTPHEREEKTYGRLKISGHIDCLV